jgi:hypothetical protein
MKGTKIYMQGVAVLTRVNGCENKIWVVVHTYKPLTDKPTRKKVFNFLMKEFGIEGMYGMSFDTDYAKTINLEMYNESLRHYNFTFTNHYMID